VTPEHAQELLAEATFAGSAMEAAAVDDRFELDRLRKQLACAAS
jgi:hypothetical protein